MSSIGGTASQCPKCFVTGHWTYECRNERVYMSRPSRILQLKNPKLKMKVSISYDLDIAYVKDESAEKTSKKGKRKHRSNSDFGSDGEVSVFETDSGSSVSGSDYSSPESSSGYSSSSDSEEERRRRRKKKKQRKGRRRRYSSSSESSDSDSASESDSDDRGSRKKSRRHNRRR